MHVCRFCKSGNVIHAVDKGVQSTVAGVRFSADLPALACKDCGETVYEDETLEALELAIADELLGRGIRSPEVFKYARKALNLRQTDLAYLFDVTFETVSRWERGQVKHDMPVFAVLSALVYEARHKETRTRERLLRAQAPTTPAL
jgi:putative zinc finger/helix-turn-helix YgiT family protein